jgi:hypothetical protein
MTQTTLQRTPEEATEIEKHKYFLSEKAGYDVGQQFAEQDWDANYAEKFRSATTPLGATTPKTEAPDAEGMGRRLMRLLAKARAR